MKIRFQMLVMVFTTAMAFNACDDDDKNDNIIVPDTVSRVPKDKYPAATGTEWERKGSYSVADCRMNGNEMDVRYDTQAIWKLAETDASWEGLPAAVQTAFKDGKYVAWRLEGTGVLEYPEQPIQYVIEVENGDQEYQLSHDQDDSVLDKRGVSDDRDDTHWPVGKL